MQWERIETGLYVLINCHFDIEIEISECNRVWFVWIDGTKTAQEFHTFKQAKNFVAAVLEAAEGIARTKFYKNP